MAKPALFDLSSISAGPRTQKLQKRSLGIYAISFGIGALLIWLAPHLALKSFGLGLIVPGGGFLLWFTDFSWHGLIHLALFFGAVSMFGASLVLWFATGNAIGPPLIWISSAFAASLMSHMAFWPGALWLVPALAIGIGVLAMIVTYGLKGVGVSVRKRRNDTIANARPLAATRPTTELTLSDLQIIRTLLDRALQPLDQFSGFEPRDQYQTAALRYQLNFAGYALSMYQANHAPAFQGYLTTAQKNLVSKQQDPRIWSYWKRENAWGNFDRNADPMARDNIMFTGFVATQIAMYHGASNSTHFNASGSLQFAQNKNQIFLHDFPGMVNTLVDNFQSSKLGLIACEPNWVYPLCNTIGAAAVVFQDRQKWLDVEPQFRRALDAEFLDHSGNMVPCRSLYTGLALPSVGGSVVQALPCFFLNGVAPDLATRHWVVKRDRMVKNGILNLRRFWPVDVGNYRFSRASSFAATAAAAVELGDDEVSNLILAALDEYCPSVLQTDVRHRPRSSLWAHGAEIMARTGRKNGFADLIAGKHNIAGISIAEAPYPDVLVAQARAGTNWLHAVFYPGGSVTRAPIKIAGLVPLKTYRVLQRGDAKIVADQQGCVMLNLQMSGRTELRIDMME